METTFDNCNNADLNNPVQNLLQNANTEFKTEKSNEIFKTDNPFNDGLNNFVQIGDTNNMHKNVESTEEMQPTDLPECEQIYQFGEELLQSKGSEKRPFDSDMGPETSVDVPDDVIMTTESSEENLSKSSLSQSKDVLPLSDNLNPFDTKNSLTDLETNEYQMQDDTKTCTTPSENLLDTPVDPVSLDDVKQQVLPADSVHTNGIHSEDDHLAEDLVHDQLPITNECVKDNGNEDHHLFEFEQDNKGEEKFANDFLEDNKAKELHIDDNTIQHFEEHHFGHFEDDTKNEESKPVEDLKFEERHITESMESNKIQEHDFECLEKEKKLDLSEAIFKEEDVLKKESEKEVFDESEKENQIPLQECNLSDSAIDIGEHEEAPRRQEEEDDLFEKVETVETRDNQIPSPEIDFTKSVEEHLHEGVEALQDQQQELTEKVETLDKLNIEIPSVELNSSGSTVDVEQETKQEQQQQEVFAEIKPAENMSDTQKNNDEDGQVPAVELNSSSETSHLVENSFVTEQISQVEQQEQIPEEEQIAHMQFKENAVDMKDDLIAEKEVTSEEIHSAEEEIKEIEEMGKDVKEEPVVKEVVPPVEATKVETTTVEIMETKEDTPSIEQICQPTAPESCDDPEDEWNYMRLKGEGEKEIPKHIETEEILSPVETKETIPEELPSSEHLQGEVESQEATIASVEESKESTSTPSVEPSADTLEISKAHLDSSEDQEVADMSSQLNPEAKEFIPTNLSPVHFSLSNGIPPIAATRNIAADDVVAQSPRKGLYSMEDIQVPSETEFENEIAHCPSEIEISPEPNELYQEMNLKEAMHGSEKEEQVCEESFMYNMNTDLENVGMKDSIYIEKPFEKDPDPVDIMNTVQPLPVESDEIKDTSMEIPVVPDTSFNEISVDNIGVDTSSKLVIDDNIATLIQEKVTEVAQDVDLLEISDTPAQSVVEPDIVKQVEASVAVAPTVEVLQKDVEGILKAEPTTPEPVPTQPSVSLVSIEPTTSAPAEPKPVETTPPDESSIQTPVEVKKEEKIEEKVVKKIEEEVVEKIEEKIVEKVEEKVAEKIEGAKTLTKVPDLKKEVKAKVPSTTAPKKVGSTTSAASSDASKPRTSQATTKPKITVTSAAPRPRTVPLASKPLTEKKTTAPNTAAAKPKVDSRSTVSLTTAKKTTAAPKTKPDEQSKVGVKQSASRTGVTSKPPVTSRTSSTTSTASKTRTTAPATNATTTKTTSQRVALSATAKSASTTKPVTSPRSTLTSTLRKTEALKSPTGTAKVTLTKTTTTSSVTSTKTSGTTKPKPPTPSGKTTSTTTTTLSTTTKKLPLSTSPRQTLTAKKSPIKKTSTTPVKKVADENKKNKESSEVKLNGTAIEVVVEVSKTELIQ